ncbi:MAG: bifunctional chorismate mutase/prephenate dehydratase [Ruminococcaceae bacterium]|nr:bifunctional chorismate mutase/prephenate dehydratase [Oscillospiraceae bacterium]
MDLSEIRDRIDEIDKPLLSLFLERMALSREVAEYKKANNLPIMNKKREREILKRVMDESGDLEQYAHRFYSTIFELSRSYQEEIIPNGAKVRAEIEKALAVETGEFPKTGTIACQGVEGAYSQMAADRMFPRGNLMFFKTFEAVFDAVESGLCRYGVVPIENSSNGSVRATYDLLNKKNCRIVRSERLCVRHELLAKPGTKLEDITEIHSHEQALGQCSEFLKSLGDEVSIIPADNTAMAAEMAAKSEKKGIAAIASHSGCENYGLVPVAAGIQNSDNNYTRFVCIAKNTEIYPGADHISLILAVKHKPGALYEILSKLAAMEVNLIKLESCPIVGHDFEFMFFFELQGSVRDPKTVTLLESLERDCEGFVFLGNYLEV